MEGMRYRQVSSLPSQPPADYRVRALERSVEFSQRAFSVPNLDGLYFLLTNDIRTIVQFDRCSLLMHLGRHSRLVAVNDTPILDKKPKLYKESNDLAEALKDMTKGLIVSRAQIEDESFGEDLPDELVRRLRSYMALSGCEYLSALPLMSSGKPAAHILFEFFENNPPARPPMDEVLRMGPLLGAALAQHWLVKKKPGVKDLIIPGSEAAKGPVYRILRYALPAALVIAILVGLLFFVPITQTVGGEAEIVPRDEFYAFCRMGGIIEDIFVEEGDEVTTGQVLATLDPKELDYNVSRAQSEFDVLTEQLVVLRNSSDNEGTKLAEAKLIELKRKSAWLDLNYYKWQRKFLEIKSPVDGIVLTKDVKSLKGKKLTAGEPFCTIAVPGDLWADVYVPEDKIAEVRAGQPLRLYLNNYPLKSYDLQVEEITPLAEANQRLGNVFRVRAPFTAGDKLSKVGMKGVGKIETVESNLWTIVADRFTKFYNHVSLYF